MSAAVDEVRRRESKETTEQKRDDLYKTRWLWLKNLENLTDGQAAHLAGYSRILVGGFGPVAAEHRLCCETQSETEGSG